MTQDGVTGYNAFHMVSTTFSCSGPQVHGTSFCVRAVKVFNDVGEVGQNLSQVVDGPMKR